MFRHSWRILEKYGVPVGSATAHTGSQADRGGRGRGGERGRGTAEEEEEGELEGRSVPVGEI